MKVLHVSQLFLAITLINFSVILPSEDQQTQEEKEILIINKLLSKIKRQDTTFGTTFKIYYNIGAITPNIHSTISLAISEERQKTISVWPRRVLTGTAFCVGIGALAGAFYLKKEQSLWQVCKPQLKNKGVWGCFSAAVLGITNGFTRLYQDYQQEAPAEKDKFLREAAILVHSKSLVQKQNTTASFDPSF